MILGNTENKEKLDQQHIIDNIIDNIIDTLKDIPIVLDDTKTGITPEGIRFVATRMKYGVNLFNINNCLGTGFDAAIAMIFGNNKQAIGRSTRGMGDKYPRYQYSLSDNPDFDIKNPMVRYLIDIYKEKYKNELPALNKDFHKHIIERDNFIKEKRQYEMKNKKKDDKYCEEFNKFSSI